MSTVTQRTFTIGPIKDGLRKDQRPFSLPEDAFEVLQNAYQFRGRITRKEGYGLLARLSTDGGTTFPKLPVMGLATQELGAVDVQAQIAFDTQNSYLLNGSVKPPTYSLLPTINTFTWNGTDSQFFWTTNYAGALWVTNGVPGIHPSTTTSTPGVDGIRFYANLSAIIAPPFAGGNGWANYNPEINPGGGTPIYLAGCLMIFPYRGYLVFLNTFEGTDNSHIVNYPNRARWTQIGTPYYAAPVPTTPNLQTFDPLAARDDIFGRGGAYDCPTSEAIVSAAFIKDVLIVYFERSVWRFRFVNNNQNPFVWERINVEFGSSSTFSSIVFDKGLMTIGDRGIVICDGNDARRIDEKIPDDIFEIKQLNNGVARVQGIRNFYKRLVYWTIPDVDQPGIYPNYLLTYNYETGNWSYFTDSFTCFGYYYPSTQNNQTWGDLTEPWNTITDTWESGLNQTDTETIIAGNQQGYVMKFLASGSVNDPSLYISAFSGSTVTSPNHNIPDQTWITLSNINVGFTYSDGVSLNGRNFKVANPSGNANTFTLLDYEAIVTSPFSGSQFIYTIDYVPILAGSVQINVGAVQFNDTYLDGNLISSGGSGTIDYNTGNLVLNFNTPVVTTSVIIRIVSLDPEQVLGPISTTGSYTANLGQIAIINNYDIQTKIFNFFGDNKRSRISKIDFYLDRVDETQSGQFTCNVFADSSNVAINAPLPDNLQSNIVLSSVTPYQIGDGTETIYRLFCDAQAQTIQLQLTMSDQQQAVSDINEAPFQLLAMMITMRRGGRLV